MLWDIFIIVYALWLVVYTGTCEKLSSKGFGYLIVGMLFTPVVGYALMFAEHHLTQRSEGHQVTWRKQVRIYRTRGSIKLKAIKKSEDKQVRFSEV